MGIAALNPSCALSPQSQCTAAAPALPNGGLAIHTTGIMAKNKIAHSKNTSFTASVSDSRVTMESISAQARWPTHPSVADAADTLVVA